MGLKRDQIRTKRDLVRAFLKKYEYMLETTPDRMTLQCMKKRPDEDYKEYAIRWKNVASMVRPPLTNQEENSMFVNTFVEFGDLMYYVGKIEDGIKRGRIVDTGASTKERKISVLDEHVQAMSVNTMGKVGGTPWRIAHFNDKVQLLINADPVKFGRLVNGHQKH